MKILLIEDEIKTAHSLKIGLEENGFQVDLAFNGVTGQKACLENYYSVIISDIILPQLSGIEIVKTVRKNGIKTPILLLTALGSTDEKIIGFDAGADDYLVKPFAFRELIARINVLSKRNAIIIAENKTIIFADLILDVESKSAKRNETNIELTNREFDLIKYLIENQNKVISKKAIAEDVWNINFDTGTNTIEVYVNYLRNKIDKPFAKKLIHTSHGMGYILKIDD
jgi:two-component system copper resistance phosphate regulon response regulator CusR